MAKEKIVKWSEFQEYDGYLKEYIDEADAKSFKTATFDTDTRILSLYKTETVADSTVADFTVTIPETDVSGLLEKLISSVDGDVVITRADGTIEDSGVKLSELATQTSVEAVDTKIGTIADLDTTNKTDLVVAINEVRNSVSAGGTEAAVTIDTSITTDGALKSYTIKQGSNTVGVIDIPKDLVVTSGTVEVDPAGQAAGTYIKLVIANQTEPLYINVGTLVDLYTAQSNATQIQLTVDNSTREISAIIVDGSVDSDALATDAVTTVKIADANVTLAKLADDAKNAFDASGSAAAAQTNAQAYTDTKIAITDANVDNNAKAITELQALVGDGFEYATSEDIKGLFATS